MHGGDKVTIMDIKRAKTEKIFNFMKELNELRNPVAIDLSGYNWTLHIDGNLPLVEEVKNIFKEEELDFVLKIGRPELLPCPEPDEDLVEWLDSGWSKLENEPYIIESKTTIGENNEEETRVIYFENVEGLKKKFELWKAERNNWKGKELEKVKCRDLYDRLFSLHSTIRRDSESLELLLGDGILNWHVSDGRYINHPILLQRLKLDFDPSVPEFTLKLEDGNTDLYTALLRTIQETDKQTLGNMVDELKENNYQIIEYQDTNSYLKRFITSVVSDGSYIDKVDKIDQSSPVLYRGPVIFLRKRTLGYSNIIDAILEDIKNTNELPSFIDKIIGEVSNEEVSEQEIISSDIDVNGIDEDILLSKPSNKEQLYVAKLLEKYGSVLVQGPPGTGKTHTIANIIGHLLSQGKSILVTSHTEKALSVLKEKIQESIQPLCLSITGSRENRKEMDATLNEMNLRRSSINETQIHSEIKDLEEKRKKYLNDLSKLREDLLLARNNEYKDIIVAGETYQPIKAAKLVKEGNGELYKIQSPVKYGVPFPLSDEELIWLYRSNELVTSSEENELNHDLPEISDLMLPEDFRKSIESIRNSKENIKGWSDKYWGKTDLKVDSFKDLANKLEQFNNDLSALDDFDIEIIDAGIENGAPLERWQELFQMVKDLKIAYDEIEHLYLDYDPQCNFKISNNSLKHLEAIIEYLKANKKLNKLTLILKKDWKEIISKTTVNEEAPQSLEDFIALKKTVNYKLKEEQVFRRWKRQIPDSCKLKDISDVKIAFQYVERYSNLLSWHSEQWLPIVKQLKEHSFLWERFSDGVDKPISQYPETDLIKEYMNSGLYEEAKYRYYQINLVEHEQKVKKCIMYIRRYISGKNSIVSALVSTMERQDCVEYNKVYQDFIKLIKKAEIVLKRKYLINKVNDVAANWAHEIQCRINIHGKSEPPQNMKRAWLIRQLHDELKRRHELDVEEIQHMIQMVNNDLKKVTEELVDRKAWYKKISTMTHNQIQAIEGWRGLMKKVGRGTGKRAPKLLAEARKLMPICQTAVPVWVMPLSKVVENFDPTINRFDVVIIDEASQSDIMAMCAIYLAKQVIIVGDDEQVSPSAVGQKLEQVQALIDTFLEDIPNAQLYDGQFSIYDLARTSGFKPVTLTEHFRCLSSIISFSNYLSYNGNIKPLRDDTDVKIKPALVEYRVEGGLSENKINKKEAETIAALILAACKQKEYNGMSFGVISLVGDKQATYIDNILQREMNPIEYTERRIQCGNPATFQGDERDIIFLSMVDSSKEDGGPLSLRSAESRDTFKKRYNVAASRARDQMWVVHSLDPDNELKEGDIRRRLIKHVQEPNSYEIHLKENIKKSESPFETEVMKYLISAGYKVVPQWKVGTYRIDMVVEGNGKRLAVECDGEKWHTAENIIEDMHRQSILERLGWTFVRVRGSEFYKNPELSMERVFKRINQLGIRPELSLVEKDNIGKEEEDKIIQSIKRDAYEILESWKEEGEEESNNTQLNFYDVI